MTADFAPAVFGLDDMRVKCAAFLNDFDALVAAKKALIAEKRDCFHKGVAEDKDAFLSTHRHLSSLANSESQLVASIESIKRATSSLESQLESLGGSESNLAAQKTALSIRIDVLRRDIHTKRQILSLNRKRSQDQAKRNAPEIKAYEDILGLKIEPVQGCDRNQVKFTFTNISALNPAKPYFFTIDTSPDPDFKLIDCSPSLDSIPPLVVDLNRSSDFYTFVKLVRKAFVTAAKLE